MPLLVPFIIVASLVIQYSGNRTKIIRCLRLFPITLLAIQPLFIVLFQQSIIFNLAQDIINNHIIHPDTDHFCPFPAVSSCDCRQETCTRENSRAPYPIRIEKKRLCCNGSLSPLAVEVFLALRIHGDLVPPELRSVKVKYPRINWLINLSVGYFRACMLPPFFKSRSDKYKKMALPYAFENCSHRASISSSRLKTAIQSLGMALKP